ncbi:MAG: hypothetical protein PHE58_07595, partial [Candidatus Omnitrophica bacterium]|nr:hypothetical protein [Candidatus Omnitrophota bacterium]
ELIKTKSRLADLQVRLEKIGNAFGGITEEDKGTVSPEEQSGSLQKQTEQTPSGNSVPESAASVNQKTEVPTDTVAGPEDLNPGSSKKVEVETFSQPLTEQRNENK